MSRPLPATFRYVSSSIALLLAAGWLCLVPLSAAQASVLITVDKAKQRMTVQIDGEKRWSWPVSTGRRGNYETPAGDFQPFRMEADHYSKEWDEAPMPYSIFFTEKGHAIHGSNAFSHLGKRASHGCVRISTGNAKKLFSLVQHRGLSNVEVVVLPDPNAPIMAKRRAPAAVQVTHKRTPAPAVAAPLTVVPVQAATYAPPEQTLSYAPEPPLAAPPLVGYPDGTPPETTRESAP